MPAIKFNHYHSKYNKKQTIFHSARKIGDLGSATDRQNNRGINVKGGFAKPPFTLPAGTGLSLDSYAFAEFFLDLLLRERTGAEEPVVAFYPFGLVVHILALHRDDHLVARMPVGRHGDPECVDGLQTHQDTLYLL